MQFVSFPLRSKCFARVNACYKCFPFINHERYINTNNTKFLKKPGILNKTSRYATANIQFAYSTLVQNESIDNVLFEKVCEETLESLCEYFEELVDNADYLHASDVSYSDGVLTINFGRPHGVYVINRQSPNKQIWLSSPTSGPKRYDYIQEGNCWLYKHDGQTLHELLQKEIVSILKEKVDFSHCVHSKLSK